MPNDPRQTLERLCLERGEDFAGLSRLLGRNPAYIQQFIRRGVPRRLDPEDRSRLARYFGISETLLGGPVIEPDNLRGLVSIPRHPVKVSAGPGAIPFDEAGRPFLAFEGRWLKRLTATPATGLAIVQVEGDSMTPTLGPGDHVLVDTGDRGDNLRDGIYVLRIDDALLVKRLALNPMGGRVTIQSDNPAYPDWPDCRLDEITCIGRVIWAGRQVV